VPETEQGLGTAALIDEQLLQMLQCPLDHSPLALAEIQIVERLNRGIDAGRIVNAGGHRLKKRIGGGLVRQAGDLLYPILDEIPVMLPDEAIPLAQLDKDW